MAAELEVGGRATEMRCNQRLLDTSHIPNAEIRSRVTNAAGAP